MDRLFIGIYPTGIVYTDRDREKGGDLDMRDTIISHASKVQARRGEQFQVSSSCGQTVRLGGS